MNMRNNTSIKIAPNCVLCHWVYCGTEDGVGEQMKCSAQGFIQTKRHRCGG